MLIWKEGLGSHISGAGRVILCFEPVHRSNISSFQHSVDSPTRPATQVMEKVPRSYLLLERGGL